MHCGQDLARTRESKVMSCDPARSLICSTVDLSLPRIGSNAKLERMIDCIYFAYLVKLPPSVPPGLAPNDPVAVFRSAFKFSIVFCVVSAGF